MTLAAARSARFVPDFRIEIEGEPVPAAVRASVTSVSYTGGLDGADRVELSLLNENLRWLESPLFALDHNLTLHMGYAAEGPLETVFAGEVVGKSASFPSDGHPSLTVTAQDRRRRLQGGAKLRWFAIPVPTVGNFPLPDLAIAGIASLENGLIPIFDPIGAALSYLLAGADAFVAVTSADPQAMQRVIRKQEGESDFDFLKRIAAENGWEMLVEHSGPLGGYVLRFMSPLDRLSPDLTLRYGESLMDFTPRLTTVGQLVSISAFIWVAPIKTTFTVTVGWDWDKMALTIQIVPEVLPLASGPSDYLIDEPVTPSTAPRRIIKELIPRLNRRLTGSGSTVGDVRIKPGGVLRLEGLGSEFGGLYRVTDVTHSIDAGGFRTSFDVRKEIWFGSIPAIEQGAGPIQTNVPFVN